MESELIFFNHPTSISVATVILFSMEVFNHKNYDFQSATYDNELWNKLEKLIATPVQNGKMFIKIHKHLVGGDIIN